MLLNGGWDSSDSRPQHAHQLQSRQPNTHLEQTNSTGPGDANQRSSRAINGTRSSSPAKKRVVFQLILPEGSRMQARLPMRVLISQHDTTESLVTTVKNFYALYREYPVTFETKEGISIIAAYENFEDDMTVYVREVPQPPSAPLKQEQNAVSPKKPSLGTPFEMRPPQLMASHISKASSRTLVGSAGSRSLSPQYDSGRRSLSAEPAGKPRPVRTKSKDNSVLGDADGYSSGENGEGSVSSSRRSKTEQVNAEISVDNIVEGGRRKRAFESSVCVFSPSHRSLLTPPRNYLCSCHLRFPSAPRSRPSRRNAATAHRMLPRHMPTRTN